jgi:hypothetical protein
MAGAIEGSEKGGSVSLVGAATAVAGETSRGKVFSVAKNKLLVSDLSE